MRTAGAAGSTKPGSPVDQSSTSRLAHSGAASWRRRSSTGAISAGVCPGASRSERFAGASTGSTVFWSRGEPLSKPLTVIDGSAVVRT